jgi:ABC-type multidrug transport system ATPase subunit
LNVSACSSALAVKRHQTIPTSQIELEPLPGSLSHRIANLRAIDVCHGGDDVGIFRSETMQHGTDDGSIVESVGKGMKVRLERLVIVARLGHGSNGRRGGCQDGDHFDSHALIPNFPIDIICAHVTSCAVFAMFKRIYVHNFRCFENFELAIGDKPSVLLIGKNGAGKSTVSFALAFLQSIARGTNRVGQLVKPTDFFLGASKADVAKRTEDPTSRNAPMRFEVDVELGGTLYQYRLALEFPDGFKELRVHSEQLLVGSQPIYSREHSKVSVAKKGREAPAEFMIDWHLVALPIIQERSSSDPLAIFKQWLARSVIIAPIPSRISGESTEETLEPDRHVENLGGWFAGVIKHAPAVYATMDAYLKNNVLRDFWDIKNPIIAAESRNLVVQFRKDRSSISLPFGALSDGEKCFFICALVLAAVKAYGPIFCFWDEPDSHLSIDEVGHFVMALRSAFESENGGQILITSHNAEAIRCFSDDNTLVLYRRSHLEPTRVKSLEEMNLKGDLITNLLLGDLEP